MKKHSPRRFILVGLVILAELILLWVSPSTGQRAAVTMGEYLIEMASILPPVFLLIGLLDAWVPRSLIERSVGREAGWIGIVLSILVGSAAAGPLYAAFPVADALLRKGARPSNVVIFLGSWASIKLPLLMAEAKFLGLQFSLTRLLLTLPAIIVIGFLVERFAAPVIAPQEPA